MRERNVINLNNENKQLSAVVVNGVKSFVTKHYIVASLWFIGLLLIQFGIGFAVDDETARSYNSIIESIDWTEINNQHHKLNNAYSTYYNSKGWFSCDQICSKNHEIYLKEQGHYDRLQLNSRQIESDARAHVGISSVYGVQETRNLFWSKFQGGKDFAKRQSMFDLIFAGFTMSRDENLVSFILRVLIQFLFNFTIGMIGTLISFMWSLWSLISTYQTGTVTGVLYFFFASVAAISLVVSILFALFGTITAAVVGTAYAAANAQRLENPGMNRGNIGYHPHRN